MLSFCGELYIWKIEGLQCNQQIVCTLLLAKQCLQQLLPFYSLTSNALNIHNTNLVCSVPILDTI